MVILLLACISVYIFVYLCLIYKETEVIKLLLSIGNKNIPEDTERSDLTFPHQF